MSEQIIGGGIEAGQGQPAEDPKLLKIKKFGENPDNFICVDDIVMAVIRGEQGTLGTMHGACKRVEMELGLTRINYKTFQILQAMDMQNEMSKKPGIITRADQVKRGIFGKR